MSVVRRRRLLLALGTALCAAAIALPAADAWARAGGGSSGSRSTSSYSWSSSSSRSSSSSASRFRYRSSGWGYSHHGSHRDDRDDGPLGNLLGLLVFLGVLGVVAVVLVKGDKVRSRRASHAACDPDEPTMAPPPASEARRHAKMDRTNDAFIRDLGRHDDAWRPEVLRARVEEVYRHVQEAWTSRDQDRARDHMTEALYQRHKRQTDHMLALGKRNVLKDIALLDVDLVYVADRQGTDADEFWAIVRGEMVDYEEIIDWERYALACGAVSDDEIAALRERVADDYQPTHVPTAFAELWKFQRQAPQGWVLHQIEHDLSQVDDMPRPFSDDAYPHPAPPTAATATVPRARAKPVWEYSDKPWEPSREGR